MSPDRDFALIVSLLKKQTEVLEEIARGLKELIDIQNQREEITYDPNLIHPYFHVTGTESGRIRMEDSYDGDDNPAFGIGSDLKESLNRE